MEKLKTEIITKMNESVKDFVTKQFGENFVSMRIYILVPPERSQRIFDWQYG